MKAHRRGDFAADRRLLILTALALPIGAVCTGVAKLLIAMIALFTNLFFRFEWSFVPQPPELVHGPWTMLVPVVGGLMIGLMARYGSERIRGHGIPEALEAILYGKSIMKPKVAILKPLSSAISIGSGGPFGAEGPIIMTGGAFGSILAQLFHLTAAERKTLLVAGAAAGMAAVFGTPMAAVLLAVELLLFEWRPRSLVPVATAAATASALRPIVLGGTLPLFPLPDIPQLSASMLLLALVAGIVAGAFSWLLSTSLYKVEDAFTRLKKVHWSWWPAMGGIVVGIGGLIEPRALGVGYDVIEALLRGELPVDRAVPLLAVKAAIWVVALGSGTSGGVLAPLLMMGAGLGTVEAALFPGPTSLWPLVSMAAVMGGMMRSPFTAIAFALELTDDIHTLPVLMVAAVAAYGFTVLTMKRSILTEKVARRGLDIFREYGVDPLDRVRVQEVMSKDTDKASLEHAAIAAIPSETCRTAAERMALHQIRTLPVLDPNGALIGSLSIEDLLRARGIALRDETVRERTLPLRRPRTGQKARVTT